MTAVFIDLPLAPRVKLMPSQASTVCQHARADFGKASGGMVDVVCLDCGHTWRQVKVLEVKP